MTYRILPDIYPSGRRECCECSLHLIDGIDPLLFIGNDEFCDHHAGPLIIGAVDEICGALEGAFDRASKGVSNG